MRSSPRGFWPALETVPGLSAVDAEWRTRFGDEYAAAESFLRPNGRWATSHPCTARPGCGCAAVSPVTVRIRADDWARLLPKLRGVKTVYICQDNELSQAGLNGALQTARVLSEHEIETRLVVLPLDPAQQEARQALTARFDLDAAKQVPGSWASAYTGALRRM